MQHVLLSQRGIDHTLAASDPRLFPETIRPRQVHGVEVAVADSQGQLSVTEADAVVCRQPGMGVGVVTADCVPILAAVGEGRVVAAIHAGWRGLAAGVVENGLASLLGDESSSEDRVAVVGPHIGPCCYEVDQPVMEALKVRYADWLEEASRPSRPDHVYLDLGRLVTGILSKAGFPAEQIGHMPNSCTSCSQKNFHSFRRDGEAAGRMLHRIVVSQTA
ncbi:MAG: polyphenol oxidase family protein [Myxococcota bacterium]|nr:polyphenol oxidase family protein [Myxococcota bacterium]